MSKFINSTNNILNACLEALVEKSEVEDYIWGTAVKIIHHTLHNNLIREPLQMLQERASFKQDYMNGGGEIAAHEASVCIEGEFFFKRDLLEEVLASNRYRNAFKNIAHIRGDDFSCRFSLTYIHNITDPSWPKDKPNYTFVM
jgi:hypothetical protein